MLIRGNDDIPAGLRTLSVADMAKVAVGRERTSELDKEDGGAKEK